MSFLKDILTELQNCVHDEHESGLPVVWSRDFQRKLAQTDHWDKVSRTYDDRFDTEYEEDEEANWNPLASKKEMERAKTARYNKYNTAMRRRDGLSHRKDDTEENEEANYYSKYRQRNRFVDAEDDFDEDPNREIDVGDDEDFEDYDLDYDLDNDWRQEFGFSGAHDDGFETGYEEEETMSFPVTKRSKRHLSQQASETGDCEACFGTGDKFPDLEGDCPECKGSGKKKKKASVGRFKDFYSTEEQEENEPDDKNVDDTPEENPDETDPTNQAVDDQYGLDDPNDDGEDFGDMAGGQEEWDDPDYQGVIRVVPGAHLVFKRQQEDGTFNELWQYNTGSDFKQELKARRAILAGTDIPINKMRSPDHTQSYELWTIGNGQLLSVKGLPN